MLTDTTKFTILAGQSVVARLEQDKLSRVRPGKHPGTFKSEDLVVVQQDHARQGYVGAVLQKTIYGWSVRYDSGLQNFSPISTKRGMTQDEAIGFGRAWVAEDPEKRYLWAYAGYNVGMYV